MTTAVPRVLRKRSAGKLGVLGIATAAGVALAATLFVVVQDGFAQVTPGAPPAPPHQSATTQNVWFDAMVLDLTHGETYPTGEDVSGEFTLHNDSDDRAEVVATAAVPTGNPALYESIFVRIERLDPTGETGDWKKIYEGELSRFGVADGGVYMGDVVARGTQRFRVYAYSSANGTEVATTTFQVVYGVHAYNADADERPIEEQPAPFTPTNPIVLPAPGR